MPRLITDTHAMCTRCRQVRARSEFPPRRVGRAGISSWCAGCKRASRLASRRPPAPVSAPLLSIEADRLAPMWAAIARETGIGRHFIVGPSRVATVVAARAVAVAVLRAHFRLSWPAIGRILGRRHSTVIELDGRHTSDRAALFCARRVSETLAMQIGAAAQAGSTRAQGAPSARREGASKAFHAAVNAGPLPH